MGKVLLQIQKADPKIILPRYESDGAAGMDLRAFLDEDISIPPLGRIKISTGLKIEIPQGYEAQVRPRSGLALKHGITVLNSPGTIDCDYRGIIEVILINLGNESFTVKNNERIAQLVVSPVSSAQITEVELLTDSKRGSSGFGSTGV